MPPTKTAAPAAETKPKSVFEVLNAIDVSGHIEKKNGLSYLSWAWAWAELKKHYPLSYYTVYHNENDWNYFTDGKTCWVKTGITVVDGDYTQEYVEELPVMDFKNASVPLGQITSTAVNKAIQRSLTKAIARHGLGLYIYAGEDMPEETDEAKQAKLELSAAVSAVDSELKVLTRTMASEEKKKLASDVVVPILGTTNYRACQDTAKLLTLLDKLKELQKAA